MKHVEWLWNEFCSESSNNEEDIDVSQEEGEDIKVLYSQYTPYQDEPLAEDDEEEDQD